MRSWIGYASSHDGIHFDRLDQPVLSPGVVPEESKGVEDPRVIKLGDVNNVVFTCGAVLLGTELRVYYGCADTVIGVARTEVKKFLADV